MPACCRRDRAGDPSADPGVVVNFEPPAAAEPHFTGHRERLRERFRRGGSSALNDYEFLELILFRAMPRRDVKPIAKALMARFGSFAAVLAARPERLDEIAGLGEAAVTELKIVEAAARRLAQSTRETSRNLGSSSAVRQ